jgi:hypothetical protein
MLGAGRYLLGVAELGLLVGFAWLGAASVRRKLTPRLTGVTAHLASAVLTIAGLLWIAELLGAFGWFKVGPYLAAVIVIGGGIGVLGRGSWRRRGPSAPQVGATRGGGLDLATGIALVIAGLAVIHFAAGVKVRLSTGMTGFDSTWYHGPFAAKFFQSGNTWSLHFIAPQFLAWFYPANSEVLHAIGMVAFGRDILSPLLNLGWFVGCLVAAWCIGRPYRVAPWSLALVAIALSVPALHDQAGEARNDIVGIFFLLAAVAIALSQSERGSTREVGTVFGLGQVVVVGLAAGLAAGTKLNFLLPAAVLVVGIALVAPQGRRWRTLLAGGLAALAGGGYWYLRNLVHTGNPLPWVKHLGPITLPAPTQALGGREDHSVLGYLTNGSVWSDWFLPGLHHGLTIFWPLLVIAPIVGLLLCLGRRSDRTLQVVAAVGLAAGLSWLIAPTSASGPDGVARGFESGLRYLAPALVLGLAVLPPALLPWVARWRGSPIAQDAPASEHMGEGRRDRTRGPLALMAVIALVGVIALGYPIQRHYLERRYADPSFTTPGLNAAFAWAQSITNARIATTSTRQYPLYGRDLSNEVTYVGTEQPHAGFTAPATCPQWRHLLDEGNYDYVITTRDRIEPGKSPYPPTARWTEVPGAKVVLRKPPTVIYELRTPLSPSACRR